MAKSIRPNYYSTSKYLYDQLADVLSKEIKREEMQVSFAGSEDLVLCMGLVAFARISGEIMLYAPTLFKSRTPSYHDIYIESVQSMVSVQIQATILFGNASFWAGIVLNQKYPPEMVEVHPYPG